MRTGVRHSQLHRAAREEIHIDPGWVLGPFPHMAKSSHGLFASRRRLAKVPMTYRTVAASAGPSGEWGGA